MENASLEENKFQKIIHQISLPIKHAIFGKQNERIEFVMDSYFKLSNESRTGIMVGGVLGAILLIASLMTAYMVGLNMLQSKLDAAFSAANQLRDLGGSYASAKAQLMDLEQKFNQANEGFVMVSVLEKKAKELNLNATGFPAQLPVTDFPANNPLSEKFQNAKVEFRVSNASIKKIVDFVVALETTPHLLRVSSLKIRGLYQDRMYFDASFEVEGTVLKKQ